MKIGQVNHHECIEITGARENNLKNISLVVPKNQLVVFTGLSGSGKSTLAFDTIYAEGQRRYIESLSSYARQFLDKINKPAVDKIEGLTPAIAIDQKTTSKNPRSTVGTIAEIYDYLRLLYARVGIQHCYKCGKKISTMLQNDIITQIQNLSTASDEEDGLKVMILAPIIKDKKGSFIDKIMSLRASSIVRASIDGVIVRLDEEIELSKTKKHTIKAVIDRLSVNKENATRIADDVEKAMNLSYGEVEVLEIKSNKLHHFSKHLACFDCKISYEELEPLSFSFNSPKGACTTCNGLGTTFNIDVKKILDKSLPLNDGGIKFIFGFNRNYYAEMFNGFCDVYGVNKGLSFDELQSHQQNALLYGGVKDVEVRYKNTMLKRPWKGIIQIAYDMIKDDRDLSDMVSEEKCNACNGNRLNPSALSVKIGGKVISEIINMPIEEVYKFFNDDANFDYLSEQLAMISKPILKEIRERLFFLYDVGLGYLSLGRDARSISGGESQRIRIASQIGSGLTGVIYVLDEPSIGLHERDTLKLINTMRNLQQKGNTLIVVEHDKKTIQEADFIVDVGPEAGKNGGEIVFSGTYSELLKAKTLTSDYLSGRKKISYIHNRKRDKFLEIKNVNINNIQNLSVKIPLGNFVCISGVSGSGKSSLVLQTLLPVAKELLNNAKKIKKVDGVEITGLENLDKVIYLDQSPIGRTPRSNPATYTSLMDDIRDVFAKTKESKILGYNISRFSFNVKGGRCEKCSGEGELKIEMHFLPDIMVKCDVCNGNRYNAQTLEVKYHNKNIAEVLNLSVDEAYEFFKTNPKIEAKLKTLKDVGLGYISLGQNATTLSGGEAQRIKLAKELSRKDTGKTLYILDEPTTGLHFADIDKLIKVLHYLVDLGNSVIVIEHNLDTIANSDYVIDMGPEGGSNGGKIVSSGTTKEIIKKNKGYTAQFLREYFM